MAVSVIPEDCAFDIAALAGHGAPNKPTVLYQHDLASTLAAYLGASIKKTNLATAHSTAAKEGKPSR